MGAGAGVVNGSNAGYGRPGAERRIRFPGRWDLTTPVQCRGGDGGAWLCACSAQACRCLKKGGPCGSAATFLTPGGQHRAGLGLPGDPGRGLSA